MALKTATIVPVFPKVTNPEGYVVIERVSSRRGSFLFEKIGTLPTAIRLCSVPSHRLCRISLENQITTAVVSGSDN